jgi:hypothetical protein
LTKSVTSLAGMVTVPSFSIVPGIQQLMAISRLVADSLIREPSVAIRTLLVIGRTALVATALPTTANPLLKSS